MTSALQITIAITIAALIGVAGAGWIYVAILHARWAKRIGAPWTANPGKAIALTVRFFSATDPSDLDNEARTARAAARRALIRAAGFSVFAMVAAGILLALLATQD